MSNEPLLSFAFFISSAVNRFSLNPFVRLLIKSAIEELSIPGSSSEVDGANNNLELHTVFNNNFISSPLFFKNSMMESKEENEPLEANLIRFGQSPTNLIILPTSLPNEDILVLIPLGKNSFKDSLFDNKEST